MKREDFLILLIKYGNIPYIWGGQSLKGADCSGLAQLIYEEIGLDPPGDQTSQALYEYFSKNGTEVNIKEADLGDLAFFGKDRITHVGICLNSILMLEAAGGGPECTTEEISKLKDAKTKVNPILRRRDFVCVIRPNGIPWNPKAPTN